MRRLFFTALAFALAATPASHASPIQGSDLFTGKSLTVQSGKRGQVLVFLSAECPCSNSHLGELKSLAKEFGEFSFLAVHSNANESRELAQKYFQSAALSFPVLQDEKAKLADEFKALKTPHAFLLSPKGEILYKGGVTNSSNGETASTRFLRAALQNVSSGQEVQTKEGRTLGCVISRK